MILRNDEERYVEEETQRSGDDRDVEADGSRADSGRRGARVGREQHTILAVESEVWRIGREPERSSCRSCRS